MKKSLLLLASIAALMQVAGATELLNCKTTGTMGGVTLSLDSSEDILVPGAIGTLSAVGRMQNQFELTFTKSVIQAGRATLSFRTNANAFDFSDPTVQKVEITGELIFNLDSEDLIIGQEAQMILLGTALTNTPRLRPVYELTECQGQLSN